MAKVYTIQNSFAAGEQDPLMGARSDTEAYKSGGKTIRNMVSDARGPARSRPGGQYINRLAGNDGRGLEYVASNGDVFAIVFTDLLVSFFDLSDLTAAPAGLVTTYTEADINKIKFVASPSDEVVYLFHPAYQTRKLEYDTGTQTWSIADVTFTAKPSNWTGTNWPSCGTFTEGRLWAGGAPDAPAEFWASKSDDYENFTTGSTAADAFNRTIAFKGKILWMEGVKDLVIGTTTAEFVCTSQDGVMWNEDINIDRQSTYGSKDIQTLQLGDQVLYVSPDGKKLRSIEYEWSKNNWNSKELTFLSESVVSSGIRDLSWAQNPDNIMWVPLEDGNFGSLSYNRSNDIFGWNSHDTNGSVKDFFSVEYQGNSYSFALVVRDSGNIDLELYRDFTVMMDSWIEIDLGTPGTVVTGLSHLEGETVQVITDDAEHPDRTVSGGQITLQSDSTIVTVGLRFDPVIETFPISQQTAFGSSRTFAKGHSKILIDVLDSRTPLVNGERAPVRSPSTPMGTAEPPITGLIEVAEVGYDDEATIAITQDKPFPLTVRAIYGHATGDVL